MRYKNGLCSAAVAALVACSSLASAQSWSFLVPESEFLAATGLTDMDSKTMASDGNGLIAAVDIDDTSNERVVLIDTNATVGSQGALVATAVSISAAIDAIAGTSPAYSSTALRTQGLGFNTAGEIIVYCDDGTNAAALVAINPVTPFNIRVLSASVNSAASPVEGGNGMFMQGDTAYLLVERTFGASEDALLAVDTSAAVSDGTATVTPIVGETELLAASGQTDANYRHVAGVALSPTELLILNSGVIGSNDDILKVTLGAPNTATTHVRATAIEAAIGATDVGFTGIALDTEGRIYLANWFGAGATDDSVVTISSVTDPDTITASFESETAISGDVGGTTLIMGKGNLAYDAS